MQTETDTVGVKTFVSEVITYLGPLLRGAPA